MYIKSQDLLDRDILTYQEILNLKKRFQGYTRGKDISYSDAVFKDEYKITEDHTEKGLEYLFRVAFKPSKLQKQKELYQKEGILDEALRQNCPLGYRELCILLEFDHFTFVGFYEASSSYQIENGFRQLYPIWRTYDKEGNSFDYYIEGGVMNII